MFVVKQAGPIHPDISDEQLMAQLSAGDIDALAPLFMRHARLVRSIVLRLEPRMSHQEAEDLCQEVFLTLHRTAPRYEERGQLTAWLCGIAARTTRSWRRRRWLRRTLFRQHVEPSVEHHSPSSFAQVAAREEIGRALDALPAPQREVIVLHTLQGLSGEEVASALGIRIGTVWTRLHRARKTLQSVPAFTEDPT